jgi:RNA polymerase sigma-70 factor (ECF subfamily)
MLKVYTGIQRFDETKGTLFNWMYTVIRNTALDKLKMAQLPATIEIDHAIVVSSDEHILKTLDWKDMYRLLDALPQATRAVCSLFYIEGFKIKEIAESLGISAGTVKWHLAETRSKLKVVFHNQYH